MKLNRTAKLAHYSARRRQGDLYRISEKTGYSVSHISNMIAGRRSVTDTVATAMYSLSSQRPKNVF